jgi:hypothetical protein
MRSGHLRHPLRFLHLSRVCNLLARAGLFQHAATEWTEVERRLSPLVDLYVKAISDGRVAFKIYNN